MSCGRSDPRFCANACDEPGDTRCNGSVIQECVLDDYGCHFWEDVLDCSEAGLACEDSGGLANCGICVKDCSGRQCGPDPVCGQSCGTCEGATEVCRQNTGQCEDVCAGRECGTFEGIECGVCSGLTEVCRETGQCEDVCAGRECGTYDGIECGRCSGSTEVCRETGQCEDVCLWLECGVVEGIHCGTCPAEEICVSGTCQQDPSELVWVEIPGGTYMMGSETGEHDDERPVHQVSVPTFVMTRTEVTVDQYQACVDAGACTEPQDSTFNPLCNWGQPDRGNHPVNCVEWQQAVTFCGWSRSVLPTEAEWEYAARNGGEDVEYPWGDQAATCQYAVMDDGGGDGCGMNRTWPVCSKTAGNTAHGICDMSGNVFEWVRDQYHNSYEGAPTDGSGWVDLWFGDRVRRGGCFATSSTNGMRASFRAMGDTPTDQYHILGIRCAK